MLEIGRRGRLYVTTEVTFGTIVAPASADAVRHINFTPTFDPKNRVSTPEKKDSPGRHVTGRFDRRETAGWNLEALLRPSGTINTVPEADELLLAAFGSKTNLTLSTTIASVPLVGGCTLTSGTGIAVGDSISIVVGGVKYGRFVASIATNAVTWVPNLPSAPIVGAVVKTGIAYKLTTALAISLGLCHYGKKTDGTAGFKRGVSGAVVDKLALNFDANDEPRMTVGGAAKSQTTSGTPSAPAAFTSVGNQPPSGISGEVWINNAAYKSMKLGIDMTNGMAMRNDSFGYSSAEEAFRGGYRAVAIGLDAKVEDETVLFDNTETGTNVALFAQCGFTEGNIIIVRAPAVEFKVPDTDDPDETPNWPFKGMALESADGANDEIFLGLL